MRTSSLIVALAFLTVAAVAQNPKPRQDPASLPQTLDFSKSGRIGSFSFEAKETASGRQIDRKWETDYGSYDRDFYQSRTISTDITSLRAATNTESVEAFWFAQRLADKKIFIYSREAKALDLTATSRSTRIAFLSPVLKSNVTNYEALGDKYVAGSKYAGWMIVLRDSAGTVMQHRSSTPTIEALTKASINGLVAEYTKAAGEE